MTDEADCSDEKIAAAIQNGIDRARKQTAMPYTGECYFCGSVVRKSMRFCDADCRDDWDAEQRAKQRQGR